MYRSINRSTAIPISKRKGEKTHHQDQGNIPNNFRIINSIVSPVANNENLIVILIFNINFNFIIFYHKIIYIA